MTLQFNLAAKRELPASKKTVITKDLWTMLDDAVKKQPKPAYVPIVWSKTPLYRALGKKITDPVVRKQIRNILGHYIKTHACHVGTEQNNLNKALTWSDTPHGHEFWRQVHAKWTPDGIIGFAD